MQQSSGSDAPLRLGADFVGVRARSILLLMLRDDDIGLQILLQHQNLTALVNPFYTVKSRLAAADLALRGLHAQLHLNVYAFPKTTATGMQQLTCAAADCMWSVLGLQ